MQHLNLHAISSYQPLGHALGEVHGAVLARPLAAPSGFALRAQATRPLRGGRISRAAEGDLKGVAAVFEIFVDRLADKRFRRAEKAIHLVFVVGEEISNGLVATRVAASTFSNQQLENVFVSDMSLPFSSR